MLEVPLKQLDDRDDRFNGAVFSKDWMPMLAKLLEGVIVV